MRHESSESKESLDEIKVTNDAQTLILKMQQQMHQMKQEFEAKLELIKKTNKHSSSNESERHLKGESCELAD